jgi:hypothetical protein
VKIGSETAPHEGTYGSPEEIELSAHLRTALALADEGDPATAVRLPAEIAALAEDRLGAAHFLTFMTGAELARSDALAGDRAAALSGLEALARETERVHGQQHTRRAALALVRATIDESAGLDEGGAAE